MLDAVQLLSELRRLTRRIEILEHIEVPVVGGGGGAIGGAIAATQVAYGTGANVIGGEAAFTYNAGTNTLTAGALTISGATASTFVYANAGSTLTSLANAAGYLTNNGAGVFSWSATAAPTAHNILSASHGDSTAAAAVRGDVITAQGAGALWTRLAISVPAATFMNYLGTANGDTEPGYKALFDVNNPTTIAAGAAAAPGTATVAARRDHTHGAPATYPATAHNLLSATHGDTVVNGATRGSLIYGNVTPAWDELVLGGISGSVLTRNATDVLWSAGALSFGGAFTLTISGNSTINGSLVGNMTGSGTVATGGFTLTVPATGAAVLRAAATPFTATRIPIASDGNTLADDANLVYSGGTLNVGNKTNYSAITPFILSGDTVLSDAANVRLYIYSAVTSTTGPQFSGFHARLTAGVPSATASADELMVFRGGGHDGAAWTGTRARIDMLAAEAFTNTNQGARIDFYTTPTGSTTAARAMRLEPTKSLLIGTTTDGMTSGGSLAIAQDLAHRGTYAGFYNTAPITKPTVSGARDDPEGALADLLTELANLGLITNSTTAS